MNVAHEILQQLGGNKFLAMTGAKNLSASEYSLTMHLPNTRNKVKAKYLTIELNIMDTYNMTFKGAMNKKDFSFPIVAHYENVYNDMLQDIFTSTTGLQTHL